MNYDDFVAKEEDFLIRINNIYITEKQINILKKYNIDINNYNNVNELLYEIETILNEESELEDLDWVSSNLSEYNYYANVNK